MKSSLRAPCASLVAILVVLLAPTLGCVAGEQSAPAVRAGNPIFPGWYADPEGAVFGKEFWVYPTYSAPYNQQVFLDAFSSPDLVNWTKHSRILDTNEERVGL